MVSEKFAELELFGGQLRQARGSSALGPDGEGIEHKSGMEEGKQKKKWGGKTKTRDGDWPFGVSPAPTNQGSGSPPHSGVKQLQARFPGDFFGPQIVGHLPAEHEQIIRQTV
ncbi:MAG: hypothetical protein NVSMB30_07800 [Hymenobacter sp.]